MSSLFEKRLAQARVASVVSRGKPRPEQARCEWKEVGNAMIRVEARPGESLDKTLRRFKKQCEKEGLTKDVRKNSYFEKPSERRRRKQRSSGKERASGPRLGRH